MVKTLLAPRRLRESGLRPRCRAADTGTQLAEVLRHVAAMPSQRRTRVLRLVARSLGAASADSAATTLVKGSSSGTGVRGSAAAAATAGDVRVAVPADRERAVESIVQAFGESPEFNYFFAE